MKAEKKLLLKNTIMLYIMRFSTYFFGFISVPYQTRVLGSQAYGKVALAMALMLYFQLIIDFGFILSGTQEIAKNSDDKKEVETIYSSIQYIKLGLIAVSFIIFSVFVFIAEGYKQDYLFYFLFFLGTAVNGLLPDYVYRGKQEMSAITYRILISRTIFTTSIFVLLKSPEDYLVVPIMNLIGNSVALLWSIIYLRKSYKIKLIPVTIKDLKNNLAMSGNFFLSRIAGTVYNSMNLILLNRISPLSKGYYAVADKLFSTGQQALSPLSDSVYPYMLKNKDFKLVRKILFIMMPVITISCVIFYIYAYDLTAFIFGSEYYQSGEIIRALLPAAVVTLPDYLFGFPVMSALGITNHANYSVYVSATIHVLILLWALSNNVVSSVFLARLISFTTIIDLIYRLAAVKITWDRKKKNGEI